MKKFPICTYYALLVIYSYSKEQATKSNLPITGVLQIFSYMYIYTNPKHLKKRFILLPYLLNLPREYSEDKKTHF